MRYAIMALLLVLAPAASAAYSEQIFSGTKPSGSSFSADGINMSILLSSSKDQLTLFSDLETVIASNGTCSQGDKLTLCMDGTPPEYYNHTLQQLMSLATFRVELIKAKLNITRTTRATSFLIGESSDLEVKVQNTGGLDAQRILFSDHLDVFSKAVTAGACTVEQNSIIWKGSLRPDASFTCEYSITALNTTSKSYQASVSYWDGYKNVSDSSSSVTFTVPDFVLKLQHTLNISTIQAGDTLNFSMNLSNTGNDTITIHNFSVMYPPSILADSEGFSSGAFYQGPISKNSFKPFSLSIKPISSSDQPIVFMVDYTVKGVRKQMTRIFPLSVEISQPEFEVEINDTLKRNQEGHLLVKIKNPSSRYSFENLRITLSGVISVEKTIDSLGIKRFHIISDQGFIAPSENGTYILELSATYDNEFGEPGSIVQEITFTVLKESVNITAQDETIQNGSQTGNASEDAPPPADVGQSDTIIETLETRDRPTALIVVVLGVIAIFAFLMILRKRKARPKPHVEEPPETEEVPATEPSDETLSV